MGMNVANFKQALDEFSEQEIPYQWKRQTIDIIVFLFVTIKARNPWLTGHSHNNWSVSIGTPTIEERGERDEPNRSTTARDISEQQVRVQLGAMKQGWGAKQGNFDIVWVYNNVPYVQALENGHSGQAPEGFIGIAIEETRTYIQMRRYI